jgi:hypothetical protein
MFADKNNSSIWGTVDRLSIEKLDLDRYDTLVYKKS